MLSFGDRFPGLHKVASKLFTARGDITKYEVDAIVNAANSKLWAGGGVCGAIHRAAGRKLEKACLKIGHCDTGDTVITPGFDLPAKFCLHTVGPQGRNDDLLASCYRTSLDLCVKNGIRSVAFPCISTGIYGFPNEPAAKIAIETCAVWLKEHDDEDVMDKIVFSLFLDVDNDLYTKWAPVILKSDADGVIEEATTEDDDKNNDNEEDGGGGGGVEEAAVEPMDGVEEQQQQEQEQPEQQEEEKQEQEASGSEKNDASAATE